MQNRIARFIKDDSGAASIEYALIATLIAIAIVGGAISLGSALGDRFTAIGTSVANAK
jgi:pilus assembly protein Flp/PilA